MPNTIHWFPHQHLVQGDQKVPKITVEEPLEDLESENIETWQKLHGHAIVAGERLQDKINELVTCCLCEKKR